jgi:abortive infection bacteriophage resistance protein
MSKIPFSKPALTYIEQIEQLKKRGLIIDNAERAIHLLESISYYRLSGYWYPLLQNKEQHIFKKNSHFDTAFNMYSFDRSLRVLIIRELEKIEISLRAKMIYILSHEYSPFWHLEGKYFKNSKFHASTIEKLNNEYSRSSEEFIVKFKQKYNDPLPPSWILLEISSFGSVSSLYSNLMNGKPKRQVANHFGLSDVVLQSWMHCIVYLRNMCAHHARLWNNNLNISPVIPNSTKKTWLDDQAVANNRTYYIMSILLYLLQTINPKNTFIERFKELLNEYPNIDVKAMGFSVNWETEKLWS